MKKVESFDIELGELKKINSGDITTLDLNKALKLVKSIKTKINNDDEIANAYEKVVRKDNFLIAFFKDLFGIRKKNFIKFTKLLNEAGLDKMSFEDLENFRSKFDILKK